MRLQATMCTVALAALAGRCAVEAQPAVTVQIDPTVQYQTILGWGKSTPWAPAAEMLREQVLERAVNDLGLTRLRLEPPSGNRTTHRNWEWLNDNGDPYDIGWEAFSTEALDARVAEWVVPFKQRVEANGDPFSIYVSPSFFDGGSSGTVPAWLLQSPGEYAEWATAILLRLRDRHGVVADYYCICNEAGNNNPLNPQAVGRMIRTLGPRLTELGLPTKIQFPESINANTSWRYIQALRDDAEVWEHVGVVSYHLYGKNDELPNVRDFARARGLPTAQTEFMNLTINHLYDDLTLGGVSYWEIYGLGGPDYATAASHVSSNSFRGGKHYWNFRQVLHYVRPGAVRIEATSSEPAVRALAFVREGKMTVVLLNNSQPQADRTVSLANLPAGTYGVCQSVGRAIYQERGVQTVEQGAGLSLEVPQNSVVTVYPHSGENQPPTATSWVSRPDFLTMPASSVTLSATAADAELDELSYAWSVKGQPPGANVALATPDAATTKADGLTAAGEYVFSVAVSDGTDTVAREVLVKVFADNQPPTLIDVHNRIPVMVTLPQDTTLLRGGAWDIEGDPLTYRWSVASQPAGANLTLETPTEQGCKVSSITVAGEYVLRLEVSDPTHTVAEDLKMTVYPQNAAPVIEGVSAAPQALVLPASEITLSATTSDPDGDVISHWWSLKRLPAGAAAVFARQGAANTKVSGLTVAGDYTFTLTVVDRTKFTTTDLTVAVAAAGAAPGTVPGPGVAVGPGTGQGPVEGLIDPPPERSADDRVAIARGTVVGTIVNKGRAWLEIRSDTGKTERYIPEWIGGMPRDGGGPEQRIVDAIAKLAVGGRVVAKWYVTDHIRIQEIQAAQ